MKLADLEAALLHLGTGFKKSPVPIKDAIRIEVDDVDFTITSDSANPQRVAVCCLFGPIPADRQNEVLQQIVEHNLALARQGSTAGFGASDGDLIYAFGTGTLDVPGFPRQLGDVMRSVAAQAIAWQQSV